MVQQMSHQLRLGLGCTDGEAAACRNKAMMVVYRRVWERH